MELNDFYKLEKAVSRLDVEIACLGFDNHVRSSPILEVNSAVRAAWDELSRLGIVVEWGALIAAIAVASWW